VIFVLTGFLLGLLPLLLVPVGFWRARRNIELGVSSPSVVVTGKCAQVTGELPVNRFASRLPVE